MSCAWQAYLKLLPEWLRETVDKQGRDTLQELRLRIGLPPKLLMGNRSITLEKKVNPNDISFVINAVTQYSPWTSATIAKGYLTGEGGHRIGICGDAILDKDGNISSIRSASSLNIRVARDFPGIAADIKHFNESIIIIGKPGWGKTTLLRDYIRQKSELTSEVVCVVDERREIFPIHKGQACFSTGKNTDILSGCSKAQGIDALLRSMNPDTIAVDEITAEEDCSALLQAGWCGVKLVATAHAGSKQDLFQRPIYRPIIESGIFDSLIILYADKSWHMERIRI